MTDIFDLKLFTDSGIFFRIKIVQRIECFFVNSKLFTELGNFLVGISLFIWRELLLIQKENLTMK